MYKTRIKQRAIRLLKLILPFVALAYVLFLSGQSLQGIADRLGDMFHQNAIYLFMVVILWPANLLLESLKWRVFLPKISMRIAVKGVLMGAVTAFVSPNRLGDFLGRVQVVPKSDRIAATMATFLSGSFQGTVTVFFGVIGLACFKPDTLGEFQLNQTVILCLGIGLAGFLLFRKRLYSSIQSFYDKAIDSIRTLELLQGLKALFWAVLRYGVFSAQLSLSFLYFGYEGDMSLLFAGIASLYLLQSIVPFTALGELGSRELIAVWLLGPSMGEPWLAAAATVLVWLVNVAVPAVVGSQIFFRSELRKAYSR